MARIGVRGDEAIVEVSGREGKEEMEEGTTTARTDRRTSEATWRFVPAASRKLQAANRQQAGIFGPQPG